MMIKKYFITGLVILLPLALTIAIVTFIVNFFTEPFVGFFEGFFEDYGWYPKYRGSMHILLQIILLAALFCFTVLLGFLTRILVFKYLLQFYDYVMHRIPIIRSVYKTIQQLIKTLFGSQSRSFKQVVLVPFPGSSSYCLGLLSSDAPPVCSQTAGKELITIFVPTTPNPTSGFLLLFDKKDIHYLDMKVEEALKYIISCGVITNSEPSPFPPPKK